MSITEKTTLGWQYHTEEKWKFIYFTKERNMPMKNNQ